MRIVVKLTGIKEKITAIKAIRILTGMGLKDSKDIADKLSNGIQVIYPLDKFNDDQVNKILRDGCLEFYIENDELSHLIKKSMSSALKSDRIDVLKALIHALEIA